MATKNPQFLIISVFVVLIAVSIGVSYFFGTGFNIFGQGLTITGISMANPPVQGQQNEWIINVLVNGYGQSITGNLDAPDITYQGASASYPLSITGEISKNRGFYLVSNEPKQPVYKYSVTTKVGTVKDYVVYKSVTEAAICDGTPSYKWEVDGSSGILGLGERKIVARECIYSTVVANKADISSLPNIIPTISLTVNVNNQPQNIELTYPGAKALPNNLGSVSWINSPVQSTSTGSLSIGQQYAAIATLDSTTWKVSYASDYLNWITEVKSLETYYQLFSDDAVNPKNLGCSGYSYSTDGLKQLSDCVKNILDSRAGKSNNYANVLTSANRNIDGRLTSYAKENNQDGFWVNLENIYATSPELVIRLRSQWVGIVFPKGEPKILSVACSQKDCKFNAGESLDVNIRVKNVGSGNGNFVVQDFVCGSIAPNAQIYPLSLPKDGEGTLSFKMTTPQNIEV